MSFVFLQITAHNPPPPLPQTVLPPSYLTQASLWRREVSTQGKWEAQTKKPRQKTPMISHFIYLSWFHWWAFPVWLICCMLCLKASVPHKCLSSQLPLWWVGLFVVNDQKTLEQNFPVRCILFTCSDFMVHCFVFRFLSHSGRSGFAHSHHVHHWDVAVETVVCVLLLLWFRLWNKGTLLWMTSKRTTRKPRIHPTWRFSLDHTKQIDLRPLFQRFTL